MAANYHKLDILKQHKSIFSQVRCQGILHQCVGRLRIPLKVLRDNLSYSSFCWLLGLLPWSLRIPTSAGSSHGLLPLTIILKQQQPLDLVPSLKPAWFHLKIFGQLYLRRAYFQIRSHSEVLVKREFCVNTIQPIAVVFFKGLFWLSSL